MIRPLRYIGLLGLGLLTLTAGCAALGWAAHVVAPQGGFKARYTGLMGQRVAIVVWADRATDWQYPIMGTDVRSSIARSIYTILKAQPKAEELKDTILIDPRQTRLWQKNNPHMDGKSLTEVAPMIAAELGATRVVYVELANFMTRDPQTQILLRGSASLNLRVAEVTGSTAKVAYEEAGVIVNFPEKTSEGIAASESVNEEYIFRGLIEQIGYQVSSRFYSFIGT